MARLAGDQWTATARALKTRSALARSFDLDTAFLKHFERHGNAHRRAARDSDAATLTQGKAA
ncbi:hypothetical protein [Methylovirgula sp. HY1]|uniref:hypothetical protein n=1 Tax=Methylovirgula sp. HY1 TaxID=2822761 RepID=UPI001C5BDBE3|nr:hypothetical protein [Methylovirgula sp. HY1]